MHVYLFLLLLTCQTLPATTRRVPEDVSTIQAALNQSEPGDTVLVAAGMYYEILVWPEVNGIRLIGEDMRTCIIDGYEWWSVIQFGYHEESLIDTSTLVKNFTLQNGQHTNLAGGIAVYNASPRLQNLIVQENQATGQGSGICCHLGAAPVIENVIVRNNHTTGRGSGIYCGGGSSPILRQVTIYGNWLTGNGGGIYCEDGSSPLLINVTNVDNGLDEVGMYLDNDCHPVLVNCIFDERVSNPAIEFSAQQDSCSVSVYYSNIHNGIVTNGNGEIFWGEGNISYPPAFSDPGDDLYTLRSTSRCIDAGTAFLALEGDTLLDLDPRGYGGPAPDMGSMEFPHLDIEYHGSAVELSWNPVPHATGYRVYGSPMPGGAFELVSETAQTSARFPLILGSAWYQLEAVVEY